MGSHLNVSFMPLITEDGHVPDLSEAAAIIFRNAGTATVNFEQGAYTLAPGETLSLNVTEDSVSHLEIMNLQVSFDTATGAVKKLQRIILKRSKANC